MNAVLLVLLLIILAAHVFMYIIRFDERVYVFTRLSFESIAGNSTFVQRVYA